MDNRLEFELGVADGLQTAWYFNWSSTTQDEDGVRVRESSFKGVSNEWELKLSDPVADALVLSGRERLEARVLFGIHL
jgi:hypothetical protein